jgi:hypothetical protein
LKKRRSDSPGIKKSPKTSSKAKSPSGRLINLGIMKKDSSI